MRKNLMRIFSLLIRYTMGLGTVLYLLRTKQIDFIQVFITKKFYNVETILSMNQKMLCCGFLPELE